MDQKIQRKLRELEETSWEFRNISPDEGNLLNILIKVGKFQNILEFGTSNGYSTIWLGEAVSKMGGQVTTVEVY